MFCYAVGSRSEPVGRPKQAAWAHRGMVPRRRLIREINKNKILPNWEQKKNKRIIPGCCAGVNGWERWEGCRQEWIPGCVAGRDERGRVWRRKSRAGKQGVCGIRGVSGTRDHWSWEGTGKPGRRHRGENEEDKNKKIINNETLNLRFLILPSPCLFCLHFWFTG